MKRNVTIHLEDLKLLTEIFEEMNLKSIEWDFSSYDDEGIVLCLIISDKPHRMISTYLTHQQIKELFEAYQQYSEEVRKNERQ